MQQKAGSSNDLVWNETNHCCQLSITQITSCGAGVISGSRRLQTLALTVQLLVIDASALERFGFFVVVAVSTAAALSVIFSVP